MKDSSVHFQKYLLPDIIKPTIIAIESNIDDDFKDAVGFYNYLQDEKYLKELSDCYETKREWLKNAYFGDGYNDTSLLDMHKIAAILCRSFLAHKPFAFDISKANQYKKNIEKRLRKYKNKSEEQIKDELLKWTINNYWCNYKAAIDVALCSIFYDLVDKLGDMEEKPNDNIYDIDINDMISYLSENGVDTYKRGTTPIPLSHETFYWSLIINIAVNDTNKRDFDYLSMATICFQIQQYSVLLHHYQQDRLNKKTSQKNI